jgi:plasmid maintenance system killer protein
MIVDFAEAQTERFFREDFCPAEWRNIEKVARRKLDMLDAARGLRTSAHRRAIPPKSFAATGPASGAFESMPNGGSAFVGAPEVRNRWKS